MDTFTVLHVHVCWLLVQVIKLEFLFHLYTCCAKCETTIKRSASDSLRDERNNNKVLMYYLNYSI